MILLGCLLVAGFAFLPRVLLVLAWLFSERWAIVWQGDWIVPLLGTIFLPYTTIMFMLVWSPSGIAGWDWLMDHPRRLPRCPALIAGGGQSPSSDLGLQGRQLIGL